MLSLALLYSYKKEVTLKKATTMAVACLFACTANMTFADSLHLSSLATNEQFQWTGNGFQRMSIRNQSMDLRARDSFMSQANSFGNVREVLDNLPPFAFYARWTLGKRLTQSAAWKPEVVSICDYWNTSCRLLWWDKPKDPLEIKVKKKRRWL